MGAQANLKVDKKFTHSRHQCASVWLSPFAETLDIGFDDRVVDRRGLGRHKEATADFGVPAPDLT